MKFQEYSMVLLSIIILLLRIVLLYYNVREEFLFIFPFSNRFKHNELVIIVPHD